MTIKEIKALIKPVNQEMLEAARRRTAALAMPQRAMGELNNLSEKLCAIQNTLTPDVSRREIFIMAGDHGVCAEGVAMYGQEVTMQMLQMMLEGKSAVCIYARHTQTVTVLVDMGTQGDTEGLTAQNGIFYSCKIARGTENFTKERAMTRSQAEQAIVTGYKIASSHIQNKKLNLITTGEMGIGNTTPSSAIAAVYTGLAPEKVVGYGAGLTDDGLKRKIEAVRSGIERHNPSPEDPLDILSAVGGYEIGGMAGVMLAAAAHNIPVVLDGFIAAAAAMIAAGISVNAPDYMIAGHESEEHGHRYLLEKLGLQPLLRLHMRLGEGTGAVCAIPLIELAAATITEIATLDEAGVVIPEE